MTTGPVGISDLVGNTNVTLITRTIRQDGTLLKPAKPLTSIDSSLAAGEGTLAGATTAVREHVCTATTFGCLNLHRQGNTWRPQLHT
eukprot:m.1279639 g.1279639  ORF g.1279639 m.1279639 type:complete len:87 (+) comp24768_c1_seq12:2016-2276(+)